MKSVGLSSKRQIEMIDWGRLFFSVLLGILLMFSIWLICRGCPTEDVFILFQRATFNTTDASGWVEAGKILMIKGKYHDALKCFEKAYTIDPNYHNLDDHIMTCNDKLFKDFEGWK